MYRQLQIRPLSHVEEFLDLIDVVEAALEGFLLGSIDPIGDVISTTSASEARPPVSREWIKNRISWRTRFTTS